MLLAVGSYNIANGREVGHDFSLLAEDILANNLDIVGLQEVDRLASRSKCIDSAAMLSQLSGLPYYYYTKTISLPGNPEMFGCEGEYGTCILSRYPITFQESIPLYSGTTEQRMIGHVCVDCDGQRLDFINTHLAYQPTELRAQQFCSLAEFSFGFQRCIVTGDFNVHSMAEFKPLGFMQRLFQKWADPVTFPDNGSTIDNILYTENMKLIAHGIHMERHSDHRLIYAQFSL